MLHIYLYFSLLCIETADRPGMLMEIIKIMADVNISVESAEIETEVRPSALGTCSIDVIKTINKIC